MGFDAGAIKTLYSGIVSHAQALGIFDAVTQHEPEEAPAGKACYAVHLMSLQPVQTSGLASTSCRVEFTGDIYTKMRARQLDDVDPEAMLLAADLMAAYSGDFTLGGFARDVDLLGAHGAALGAQAVYVNFQGTAFRVMRITLPIILNDVFTQGG